MSNPQDELRALIQSAKGASQAPDATPQRTPPRDTDLRSLAQQARPPEDGAATDSPTGEGRRAMTFAVLVAVLIAGWLAWRGWQPAPSGPAATLHQLAQSVEQYRHSRNGSLPEQLSNLEHFPKNAVQWQLQHWKARDAAGRTEIIWAPNGPKHYRIVLRQGTQVWVYSDLDGQARQTHH